MATLMVKAKHMTRLLLIWPKFAIGGLHGSPKQAARRQSAGGNRPTARSASSSLSASFGE